MIHGTAYTETTSSRLLLLHYSPLDWLTKNASSALVSQVGSSEAALLTKLGMKPFEYGLRICYVWEGGVFPPDVLKIDDAALMALFNQAVGNVAALSLATSYPTEASLPHLIVNGAKNVTAVALEAGYIEFDVVKKIKDILDAAGL